jgi:hypothetical protein
MDLPAKIMGVNSVLVLIALGVFYFKWYKPRHEDN